MSGTVPEDVEEELDFLLLPGLFAAAGKAK
jgi:hypothetical protein